LCAAVSESADFFGVNGATHRLGRGVSLRGLPNKRYDRERKELDHRGAYLPIIIEACQEQELSYEYRVGANSYGAFTFALAKILRETHRKRVNPNFRTLTKLTADRLKLLGNQQPPCLVGTGTLIGKPIPWVKTTKRHK